MQNQCAEIKIRTEVRAGEILLEMPSMGRGGDRKSSSMLELDRPTLAKLGVKKTESHRVQTMARMPEAKREKLIEETKAAGDELTSRARLIPLRGREFGKPPRVGRDPAFARCKSRYPMRTEYPFPHLHTATPDAVPSNRVFE